MNRWKFLAIYIPSALACYGVGAAAGVKSGTGASAAIGWGGGLVFTFLVIIVWRRRSYAAGFRVEAWRSAAVALRESDLAAYQRILLHARSDAKAYAAAQRDPDAYVGLTLSYASEDADIYTEAVAPRLDSGVAIDNGAPAQALRGRATPARMGNESNQRDPKEAEVTAIGSGRELEVIREFLADDDWPFEQTGDNVLATGFTGESGTWRVFITCRDALVVVYSIINDRVPEPRRGAVSELLTRINYGISVGNFELDFSDGETRYKTSADVSDTEESLTTAFVGHLLYLNVLQVDRYYPALMAVVHAGQSPTDAIAKVETSLHE